jgi:hypothetical protein
MIKSYPEIKKIMYSKFKEKSYFNTIQPPLSERFQSKHDLLVQTTIKKLIGESLLNKYKVEDFLV